MSLLHVSLLYLWGCGGGWEKGQDRSVGMDREGCGGPSAQPGPLHDISALSPEGPLFVNSVCLQ